MLAALRTIAGQCGGTTDTDGSGWRCRELACSLPRDDRHRERRFATATLLRFAPEPFGERPRRVRHAGFEHKRGCSRHTEQIRDRQTAAAGHGDDRLSSANVQSRHERCPIEVSGHDERGCSRGREDWQAVSNTICRSCATTKVSQEWGLGIPWTLGFGHWDLRLRRPILPPHCPS